MKKLIGILKEKTSHLNIQMRICIGIGSIILILFSAVIFSGPKKGSPEEFVNNVFKYFYLVESNKEMYTLLPNYKLTGKPKEKEIVITGTVTPYWGILAEAYIKINDGDFSHDYFEIHIDNSYGYGTWDHSIEKGDLVKAHYTLKDLYDCKYSRLFTDKHTATASIIFRGVEGGKFEKVE